MAHLQDVRVQCFKVSCGYTRGVSGTPELIANATTLEKWIFEGKDAEDVMLRGMAIEAVREVHTGASPQSFSQLQTSVELLYDFLTAPDGSEEAPATPKAKKAPRKKAPKKGPAKGNPGTAADSGDSNEAQE